MPVISPLMEALYQGRTEEVQRLLAEAGPETLTVHEAAAVGDVECLERLVTDDPSLVNDWAPDGFQPLILAAFFGRRQAVELLLSHGADVTSHARHPFKVAALHSALAGPDHEIARLLVEAGADVNARQQGGVTPLHEAAMNGEPGLTQLLLDHGADPTAADDRGRTAVDFAREAGHADVLDVLQSAHAS